MTDREEVIKKHNEYAVEIARESTPKTGTHRNVEKDIKSYTEGITIPDSNGLEVWVESWNGYDDGEISTLNVLLVDREEGRTVKKEETYRHPIATEEQRKNALSEDELDKSQAQTARAAKKYIDQADSAEKMERVD